MATIYLYFNGYFHNDNVPCQKSQVIWNLLAKHDYEFNALEQEVLSRKASLINMQQMRNALDVMQSC